MNQKEKITPHRKPTGNTGLLEVAVERTQADTEKEYQVLGPRLVRSTAALSSFTLLVAALALLLGQHLVAVAALVLQTVAFATGWKAPLKHRTEPWLED
jgi:hypothetical protein